jgi:hypothetical protein
MRRLRNCRNSIVRAPALQAGALFSRPGVSPRLKRALLYRSQGQSIDQIMGENTSKVSIADDGEIVFSVNQIEFYRTEWVPHLRIFGRGIALLSTFRLLHFESERQSKTTPSRSPL